MAEAWIEDPHGGFAGRVRSYGHWGRPVLGFPAEGGSAGDYESNGMVAALAPLLDAGRMKLYCVDSDDGSTWSNRNLSLEDRARRHDGYERWVREGVVAHIADDSGGRRDIVTIGTSLGAFHAVNIALRHAHLFPVGIGLSGNYDPALWHAWGERGDASYFHNPVEYVSHLDGDHLDWLRGHVHLVLVVGQGAFEEHPTHAISGTQHLAHLLATKGISHDLDLWGHDVPHDWASWQRQAAHHLPRFC